MSKFKSLFFVIILLFTTLQAVDPKTIKTVHVVASNHLDVGFTDYIVNVVNEYWDSYFPKVTQLKTQFASNKIPFTYLTHCWLLSLYLECPPNAGLHCPSNKQKQELITNLLSDKTLTFHAFPFNSQNEYYDTHLFEYGLYLSTQYLPSLISNYTGKPYTPPIALSQRDVPGITSGVIPLLIKYNVSAISIGCNGQSAPPSITNKSMNAISLSEIFMWKDTVSNKQIITMIHKGGYGGINTRDAVMIDGYDQAVLFDWNSDNKGPKSFQNYQKDITNIKQEFPNANVIISTLDDYVNNLLAHPDIVNGLPVITAEIGDTWQYGSNADPKKLAKSRIAINLRRKYIEANKVSLDSFTFNNFSRFLLKNGEHTFGITHGKWNNSKDAWSNAQLNEAIKKKNKDIIENVNSWNEQRRFGIRYALDALSLSNDTNEIDLYNDIEAEYKIIDNVIEPDLSEWNQINNISQIFTMNGFEVQFNSKTGALNKLYDINNKMDYINSTSNGNDNNIGFGLFYYTTRTENDFNEWFTYQYSWFGPVSNCSHHQGYCKLGLQANANPKHQNLRSNLVNLYNNKENKNIFMSEINMGEYQNNLKQFYGAASKMYNIFNFSLDIKTVNIELILINKTFTRIPENLWVVFNGNMKYDNCMVKKLGKFVDVNDVLLNGTKHLHYIEPNFDDSFVRCLFNNNKSSISVQGIDTGNIAFVPNITSSDDYSSFPVPLNVSNDLDKGLGFMLFNNVWNTNYPYWMPFDHVDANSTFRFSLVVQ